LDEGLGEILLEEESELLLLFLIVSFLLDPRLHVGSPLRTEGVGDEKDTGTRHGSGGGETQVTDFEDESHVGLQSDTLVGGKGEEFVIVHHRVHGLDPVGIKITIENDPLRVCTWGLRQVSHGLREETILPLSC